MLVGLSKKLNPLFAAVLRSPLHWLVSPALALITVTGRKTGRRYSIPVGYHDVGDAILILVAEAPAKTWWRNYRQPGPMEILLRGKRMNGRAVVLPAGSEAFRRRLEQYFERAAFIPRIFGITYDRRTGLTAEQEKRFAAYGQIVELTVER